MRARGANRQTILNPLPRNAKNIANRISPQSKKRHRSNSSEPPSPPGKSGSSDGPVPSRERTVQSRSRQDYRSPHHPRRRRRSPKMPSDNLTSDRKGKAFSDDTLRSGYDNSTLGSRNRSYLIAEKSPPRSQKTKYPSCSRSRGNVSDLNDNQYEFEEQIV
jgi:hypothetical protein